jgi:hypothetical protein
MPLCALFAAWLGYSDSAAKEAHLGVPMLLLVSETNRNHLVLFGMQIRTTCPYLAAIDRTLIL